ncbi:15640_t:CDS:10, partial [Funneliformis caledonium]
MHDQMILSLIARIGLKLPCKSGKKLDTLEADSLVQHIVNAIVDLSRYKLATIVQNLSKLLEEISESTPSEFVDSPHSEHLQSQLLILKILSACMTAHWKYYRGMQLEISSSQSPITDESSKLPKSWDDPPTLDEKLAKYILKVLSRFLYLMASQEDNNPNIQVGPSGGRSENSIHNINSQAAWSPAIYDLVSDIFKNAGRVIFYISASNWEVVFARIRTRIAFLSSTDDEWPDTSELKVLECSDLNSTRLSMILQAMAVVLRKAIWNWIEVFPAEFVKLCQSQASMDGASSLFDIIAKKDRSLFWPVQTMLLILCPDKLMSAIKSDKSAKQTILKIQFFDTLKRSLRNKNAEVAAVCYVDIFKASTYVKNEASALRLIVPDIENELKETLFDPNRPFPNEQNVDQKLMTDCLTALFRISPGNTLRSLIPTCVHENVPNAFKLVLVKSCYSIASEESRFPWSPKIKSMYPFLADPLRKLFLDLINARTMPSDTKKPQKKIYEDYQERSEIILNILKLYRNEPYLAIVQEKYGQAIDNQSIILGIMKCLNDTNDSIKTTAIETLLELHTVDLINLWGPEENKMHNFWSISTAHKAELITPINVPDRLTSNIQLEIALLVSLCSSEIEICSLSINCFSELCREARITTENFAIDEDEPQELPISPQITIVDNWNVYTELSVSPYIVPGRMSQQRRIRKLLRLMTRPTAGNFGAWEEAWNRWKDLTEIIAKPSEESIPLSPIPLKKGIIGLFPGPKGSPPVAPVPDISESQSVEWHNYTGFLAALGGCCVIEKTNSRYGRTLGTSNQRISIPSSDCMAKVERFVQEMVSLLVSGTIFVRETVKDTLGNELSPRLYVILFSHLESIVSRFFDKDGEATPNERFTLFIEQAISVLKLILERIYDVSDNLYSCDLGGLVLSFARYLNRLSTSNTSLRIKKKMCQLAELLMLKKEYVNLRQEIKLRNKLIEIIMEWTSDSSMKSDNSNYVENNTTLNNKSERSEKLHRDLDQGCLKTIVALLQQLPLQPSETPHESEISSIKSKMFYKYFSFFIKLLNRCRILEAIDSGTHSAKNNQDLQMLLSKSKEYVKDLGPLKEYTILALSNLLSANVDSGLKFSLSMGYHEDSKTRTAFMQVLTNILNQGTEFEGLDENAMKERYNRLVEVVTNSDLDIALSLCEVCHVSEQDESTKVLISVFDSQNKLYPFFKVLFENEVNQTDNKVDLFRKTNSATRFLTYFAKAHGIEYLRETLQPVLNELFEKPPEYSCELYKDRLSPEENFEDNLKNLQELAEAFINAICGSSEKVPRSFRYICHHLATAVEVKFPELKHRIVGSFIFLRFFNPTLVAPDNKNLCKPIENMNIKRALLLVTKIIQNLANDVRFVAPSMMIMNNFLEKHVKTMNDFLEEISQLPYSTPTTELKASDITPCRLDENDKKSLHKLLHNNQEKMARELSARRVKYSFLGISMDSEQAQTNKTAWEKLGTLLAQLGPPAEQPRKETIYAHTPYYDTTNHFFGEFMRRNKGRNLDSIAEKRIFYESGVSRERRPVFYYIARRLEAEATDIELLMYHVLNTIEFRMGQPFEVVVDLTQFGSNNEVQSQWVQQFIQIHPFDIQENLAKLYFYNTNTTFKKFVKKLSRPLSPKIAKKTLFCCNLTELHEYIAPGEIGLPRSTTILDTDNNGIIHTPVTKISHYRMHIPVTIKISSEFIQILTLRRQDLFYGLSCQLNDVYHISDIEDITNSTHRNDDNEFIIKQD